MKEIDHWISNVDTIGEEQFWYLEEAKALSKGVLERMGEEA